MLVPILIAVSIPLAFLYVIHRLDLYGSERPRTMLLCLAWGLVALAGAYVVNHSLYDVIGKMTVVTISGPITEELLKSLVLIYLVRRSDFTYFVDGAIYGFAIGIGFAAGENVSYLYRVPESQVLAVAIVRVFTASLLHGTATGLVGTVLGRLRLSRSRAKRYSLAVGLGAAMALHLIYNNVINAGLGLGGLLVGLVIGLGGVALLASLIKQGLKEEKQWLQEELGLRHAVSEEEANLVLHPSDVEKRLAVVRSVFGPDKSQEVRQLLHLEAQLGLKKEVAARTDDAELSVELKRDITDLEKQLERVRQAVGLYCMSYIRSILPPTRWSIWMRLAQVPARPASVENLWLGLARRLPAEPVLHEASIYTRLEAEMALPERGPILTPAEIHNLPGAVGHCMRWLVQEKEMSLQHLCRQLSLDEAATKALLGDLIQRGLVRRVARKNEHRYQPRVGSSEAKPTVHNVWHAVRSHVL